MSFDKEIEDAQKFLRNGSPPLGLAAGNNGHLVRHPLKPELFLYNINGKYLQQNNQTWAFTEDEIRKYAGAQRLREKFAEDLNSGKYEKENKNPAKTVEHSAVQESPKHAWVKGQIHGAVKKESRSEVALASLYLQAGSLELGLKPNKGMFMKNPNNREERLYVVNGKPIKDKNNQIISFNNAEIALMAFEQKAREDDERMYKAMREVDQPSRETKKAPEKAPPQSQQWVPAKRSK